MLAWITTRSREPTLTENQPGVSITLWDSTSDPSEHSGLVYRWNGYAEKDSIHSLLRYTEIHGEQLRRKYLGWIHDFGETRIGHKRLIDHLAFEDGLSYWWMTSFVEKSSWKTNSIIDAIRLFAFEEIVLEQKAGKVMLVSADRRLHGALSGLCHGLGIVYDWKRLMDKPQGRLSLRSIYQSLPQPARALISLVKHLRNRWRLRRAQKSGWFGGDRSLFFCSYFIHLDQSSCKNGRFYSHQWEVLPKLLHDRGFRTNWIQHYLRSSVVPNTGVALDWVQHFNKNAQEQGFHTFLDAYLSWCIVLRVLIRWVRLNWLSWRLGSVRMAFVPEGSHLTLWPIMRKDWQGSMRGPAAIRNLLWIELFYMALRDIPHQKKGLYLSENQAWERALIHAWQKGAHGQLIAVAHSTVRFRDLRYFSDPRTLRSTDPHLMPQPDLTALNGKVAVEAFHAMGFPKEAIVECEALRYGHLNDLKTQTASVKLENKTMKVLILGDYVPSVTINLLQLLGTAMPLSPDCVEYTIKPHPSFPVKAADFPNLNLTVIMSPLGNILQDFDIAYSSNKTSAAVDAYFAGLPVVVMLDDTELNFSPLRGQAGVSFVSTPEELAEALQTADKWSTTNPNCKEFFFIDSEIPRWRQLLFS